MALKLIRNGEAGHLQDHNLLKNLELENQHPIKAITGLQEALDSKANSNDLSTVANDLSIVAGDLIDVDERVTEIERKIEDGEIVGSGGSCAGIASSLKYSSVLEYEGTKLVKETFTGDINKVVDYSYDANKNITQKTVTRDTGETVKAEYTYNDEGNLVGIKDDGTDEVYLTGIGGFVSYVSVRDAINGEASVNINSICEEKDFYGVHSSELLITSIRGQSQVIVTQSGQEVLNVYVYEGDTQKYLLGINKDTVINFTGNLFYDVIVNGIKHIGEPNNVGGVGDVDSSQIEQIVNKLLQDKLKDLQLADMKMQFKYDKVLGLNANYTHNYYIDTKLNVEKEGE